MYYLENNLGICIKLDIKQKRNRYILYKKIIKTMFTQTATQYQCANYLKIK